MGLIRTYQIARGPRPSPCRYLPTCSEYGFVAVERFGVLRGGWLTLRRLSRCHPFGGSGFDPVPSPGRRIGGDGVVSRPGFTPAAAAPAGGER